MSLSSKEELEKLRVAARATGMRDQRVGVQLSPADVRDVRALAVRDAITFQTLIASILLDHVPGRLVERG